MKARIILIILAIALLISSLSLNIYLSSEMHSLYVGKSMVEFYGAIGSDKAVGIVTEPLLIKIFGEDWRNQRLFMRTTATGESIWESNYIPIAKGTYPIFISPKNSESHYQLYSVEKKIDCGLVVDFKKKSVKLYVPPNSGVLVEEFLPNGELRLVSPRKRK